MSLITTDVEVNLVPRNIKYYDSLGYELPRRIDNQGRLSVPEGSKLIVDVNSLPKGSGVRVDCMCDECQEIYSTTYRSYNLIKHNGNTYCNKCVAKLFRSGANHKRYKPEKTDEERILRRNYPEYRDFAKKVMARDNYTCQCCGKKANAVHHLNAYSEYVEQRTDVTNGVALCKDCHDSFHNWHTNKYGYAEKGKNTKYQFEEWLGYAIEILEYKGEIPKSRQVYCIEEDKIYDSATRFAEEKDICYQCVKNVLDRNSRFKKIREHILWYDEYLSMTDKDISEYLEWYNTPRVYTEITRQNPLHFRNVICVTTNKSFISISEAERYYNVHSVRHCCIHKSSYAGMLDDGTPLQWLFYDEYLSMTDKEIEAYKQSISDTPIRRRKVVLLNTREVFNSVAEASRKTGVDAGSIHNCCSKLVKTSGKNQENGERYVWVRYDEYIKMSDDEISILLDNKSKRNKSKRKHCSNGKMVICTTNNAIYPSIDCAAKHINLKNPYNITLVIRGDRNYAGKLPDGTKLKWMYLKDFIEQNKDRIDDMDKYINQHMVKIS